LLNSSSRTVVSSTPAMVLASATCTRTVK
jgi:hypothetical protein